MSPPDAGPGGSGPDVTEVVVGILTRYVSVPTAHSVLKLARAGTGTTSPGLSAAQLRGMLVPIERHLRLFLSDLRKAGECRQKLDNVARETASPQPRGPVVVPVRIEDDIVRARNLGRSMAAGMGFSSTGQTRLATAVSELARNLVQYAGEGEVHFLPTAAPGIEVVSKDRGPGIPNLEQILNGTYKSRHGMGLGLRGVKRLGDRFEVQTAAGRGTTVSFHLRVT